ncbi:MAG: iron-containing alcohol dehydrogenase [Burkholderiales bacterium]|nr:iron-containing alcohol dehydrogenase [Burkholderiales bacterium]
MISGKYDFIQQERVIYGRPAADALSQIAEELGARRLFVVASKTLNRRTDVITSLRTSLGDRVVGVYDETEEHSPRASVLETARAIEASQADLIITVGGGSPIDTVKVAQIVLAENIRTIDQLGEYRVTMNPDGSWKIPPCKPSPVRQIIVPTTLSAAEFSNIGGCTDRARQVKDLYVGKFLCAQMVVLDPALTVHTPEWLWLSTGIRAVDHAVESICSRTPNPFVAATCAEGLRMLRESLPANRAMPADLDMRLQSQLGVWLASTGMGRVEWGASHGIGHQLGAVAGVAHGHTSCVMLPSVMRFNRDAVEAPLRRIAQAFDQPQADAADLVQDLIRSLGLPTTLREVKVEREQFDRIAASAMQSPMVLANPRPISHPDQVKEILDMAF